MEKMQYHPSARQPQMQRSSVAFSMPISSRSSSSTPCPQRCVYFLLAAAALAVSSCSFLIVSPVVPCSPRSALTCYDISTDPHLQPTITIPKGPE